MSASIINSTSKPVVQHAVQHDQTVSSGDSSSGS